MYAPAALSSLASSGSTMLSRVVTFFALSLGTCAPQLLQEMKPELPLPPFDLPRLFLFFVILDTKNAADRACLKGWGPQKGRQARASLKTLPGWSEQG